MRATPAGTVVVHASDAGVAPALDHSPRSVGPAVGRPFVDRSPRVVPVIVSEGSEVIRVRERGVEERIVSSVTVATPPPPPSRCTANSSGNETATMRSMTAGGTAASESRTRLSLSSGKRPPRSRRAASTTSGATRDDASMTSSRLIGVEAKRASAVARIWSSDREGTRARVTSSLAARKRRIRTARPSALPIDCSSTQVEASRSMLIPVIERDRPSSQVSSERVKRTEPSFDQSSSCHPLHFPWVNWRFCPSAERVSSRNASSPENV